LYSGGVAHFQSVPHLPRKMNVTRENPREQKCAKSAQFSDHNQLIINDMTFSEKLLRTAQFY
jgi:hypothetical protein